MANWCLSHSSYKTLEKIFKKDPPDLFWKGEIQPLFEELKAQLGGNKIPKDNDDELKRVKLDSKDEIQIRQSGLIGSTVVRTKIKICLIDAGVTPVPLPKGRWARLKVALSSRRCNH